MNHNLLTLFFNLLFYSFFSSNRRDLKPENILLDREGHVRLCDFGFAATVEHSASGSAAAPLQDGCGTVMYMAPELAGKTPGLTHGLPVDWWALGCVLFELVTGKDTRVYN